MAATSLSSAIPNLFLSPFPDSTRCPDALRRRTLPGGFSFQRTCHRGSVCVARFGFRPGFFPDPDDIKGMFDRAEGLLYTIADAAVSNSDAIDSATSTTKQNGDWLSGITYGMESVLKVLKGGLSALHVPYSYGFAIILLTVLVKAATFPLTKKQVESAMSMRSLQPQVKAIQQRYAGDQEKIQLETARLYKLAGINPLAGCLPTLATIPVWIGLYRALSNVADEGLLTEGFFWIPSLAGPTTIAARQNGSGISWLFPFVDGNPPLGWYDTLAYLVLPVLLIVSQYISVQIMQSSQNNDPNMKNSQAITQFLPLLIGYFSLSVPSGLSLYWLTNNILSTGQQVWLQKLGGAKKPLIQFDEKIINKDQLLTEETVSKLSPTKTEAKQGEQLTSEGPRPGERFKQLKEQEARRKQQREEEQRKAQEAAAKGTQISNEGPEMETKSFEVGNGVSRTGTDSEDDRPVNGTSSGVDASKDENSEDKHLSQDEKLKEAVEVYGGVTTTDPKIPKGDARE